MKDLRQELILEIRGGYYDFKDPKFIYINKSLPFKIREEVAAHERFHRTLTTTTIYGQLLLAIDYYLSNYQNHIPDDDYKGLILTRNKMFYNMYHVQEAGAIARTYAMLPYIYLPKSISEVNAMQSGFYSRLVSPYDKIAKLYMSFICILYKNLRRIPSSLITYTNDAITAFACNPILFKKKHEVDLTSENCLYLNKSVCPDLRFFKILDELVKPENNMLFFNNVQKGLEKVFDITDIYSPGLHSEIEQKMLHDVEGFEYKMINMIDKCLRSCIPDFSVEQENHESFKLALHTNYQFHGFFKQSVPDYKIPKVYIADKQCDKERIITEDNKTFT